MDDRATFEELASRDPRQFWTRIVDSVVVAGVQGLELTFPPGNWETAVRAYRSASGFSDFLRESGTSAISGFFDGLEREGDLLDAPTQRQVIEEASRYAGFLSEAGAGILVAGMPMRTMGRPESPSFVDLDYAKALSDLINRVGAASLTATIHPLA